LAEIVEYFYSDNTWMLYKEYRLIQHC
jgi:hypothetical protein